MEPQTVINILAGAVGAGLGWFLNSLHRAHEKLRQEVNELAVSMPTHYAMKSDMHELRDAIFARFDRLEEKMDRKADK